MSEFSPAIADFWLTTFLGGEVLCRNGDFTVAIHPGLSEDRRLMVLETAEGRVMAVMTPALADRLALRSQPQLSEPQLRRILRDAGLALHGADYIFYFPQADKAALADDAPALEVRRLTERDEAAFAEFQASASEQDLDDAYVELDHWAVFGAIEQGRLTCAASMYPWSNARVADLGVLTLPPFRSRGHARAVVRAISRHACEQGHEPQYRCQLDNQASVALAKAAGLRLFGKWEVISPDAAE
ncbi:GNAT family N-acetyltransferase [Chromobacterium subtsugae]|uniref:GNAT family N-acetyltransferase n=1 Tax=Chromobacterium subtsugae TaxID=251747 RepID=A0ABS7FIA4_9NEIS|nr:MULTISPECIES: GNAT family N-acetyltransferase [Chromobacterium]KUM05071.1 acetyltransferase [Chromobacterium subtsugae]KZE85306.1 acetyltransferase [Chromobacterium sp. F49]MBW7569044.1 GNAT family N-acetyltransferase [Chromobacterium subtsugae]MBW8289792.1 GNAT family N-acetyltransferase [Chromobacterium subtsugae]WSE93687.1 GNAT family N-acetyltransferase [Chromobacterium subtsugae]